MFCFLYCDDVWLGAVFIDFYSDAVYVDLKYDDVLVLCMIFVCERGGVLLDDWRCCNELCGCVNGASQSGLYCRCFIRVYFR